MHLLEPGIAADHARPVKEEATAGAIPQCSLLARHPTMVKRSTRLMCFAVASISLSGRRLYWLVSSSSYRAEPQQNPASRFPHGPVAGQLFSIQPQCAL
jgi:hypothetical protein